MSKSDIYYLGAILTGIVLFLGIWLYAIMEWGFLFGLMLGWFPAATGAFIGGAIWPLLLLFLVWGLTL